jgi:hypothetical protein
MLPRETSDLKAFDLTANPEKGAEESAAAKALAEISMPPGMVKPAESKQDVQLAWYPCTNGMEQVGLAWVDCSKGAYYYPYPGYREHQAPKEHRQTSRHPHK